MLSAVLNSGAAVEASIIIMRAFVEMRRKQQLDSLLPEIISEVVTAQANQFQPVLSEIQKMVSLMLE